MLDDDKQVFIMECSRALRKKYSAAVIPHPGPKVFARLQTISLQFLGVVETTLKSGAAYTRGHCLAPFEEIKLASRIYSPRHTKTNSQLPNLHQRV